MRAFVHKDITVSAIPDGARSPWTGFLVTPLASGAPVKGRTEPAILVVLLAVGERIVVFAPAIAVVVERQAGARADFPGFQRKHVDLGKGVVVREREFGKDPSEVCSLVFEVVIVVAHAHLMLGEGFHGGDVLVDLR